jgi:hypothetical protein
VTVFDAGGKTTGKAAATLMGTLRLRPFDDPPVLQRAALYAVGGLLSSADDFALVGLVTDAAASYRQRMFTALKPPAGGAALVSAFALDLTKVADGVFARGAITDVDTADPPSAGVDVVAVSASGAESSLSAFAAATTGVVSATFLYDPAAPSSLRVALNAEAARGPYRFRLQYGSPGVAADFYVHVRERGCTLAGASNYALAVHPLEAIESFYPDNSGCAFAPTPYDGAAPAALDSGTFAAKQADMGSKLASLAAAGASVAEKVEALSEERAKAKGSFAMAVPAGAASALVPLQLSAVPPAAATVALLPALPAKSKAAVDASSMLVLGPACTAFSKPVRICLFVGDTAAAESRSLQITSQLDCNDAGRGYGPYENAGDVSFDRVTGQVCGWVSHFSVGVVTTVGVEHTPVVARHYHAGGLCPQLCSGRGACLEDGRCACHAGFGGYDCARRACPRADAWDLAWGVGARGVAHATAECAGRGACNTVTGACECFPGFEGTACQRAACPAGCSGRGRCRLLGELALPHAAALGAS